jgi:hypothetical protein
MNYRARSPEEFQQHLDSAGFFPSGCDAERIALVEWKLNGEPEGVPHPLCEWVGWGDREGYLRDRDLGGPLTEEERENDHGDETPEQDERELETDAMRGEP